ncbi:3 exoribonuclease domain 1 domain-containing protein [Cystoisospora suis]|uniref:3 exoribonuclease domain 1 domain-containing protein n=1 Tax=Cystoisospora suis TaxID=483139 RepID=A0A2C6JUM6_9APIC|nr:3 exoribonuclease domain 1 domain-containing protein [Cystoisospora suis]
MSFICFHVYLVGCLMIFFFLLGIAMKDLVVAVQSAYLQKSEISLLDPSRSELQTASPTLTLALLSSSEDIVLMQMNSKVSMSAFEKMYEACRSGCREIAEAMKATVRETATRRAFLSR